MVYKNPAESNVQTIMFIGDGYISSMKSPVTRFLSMVRDCGISYALQNLLAHFRLKTPYSIESARYVEWEKADKVKYIITKALNWNDFVSLNGDLVNFSQETILKLRNGIQIYVRPDPIFNTDLHVIYETILRQDYGHVCTSGVVIDIGAYIGDFTVLAANAGATVYAFEPSRESFKQLLRNVALMKLSLVNAFNVAIVPHSLTGSKGSLFLDDGLNLGSGSVVLTSNTSEQTVECTSLRDIFEVHRIEKCELLKIDCEGAEYEILETLEGSIYAKIQRIVLEFHQGCPKKLEKLRRTLEDEGFFVKTVVSAYSRTEGILYCWKKGVVGE